MSAEQAFIIVTGAGRSGTSAIARVLHESGVSMGRSMAEPSEANPEGFYEDLEVVELNERILTDTGMNNPWRPERWPSRRAVVEAGRPYHSWMAELVDTGVRGWKDPRFSLTLEAWLPALPKDLKVVVCLRSPQAYADSSVRIYGLVKPARARREWARHYRRLLAVIERHGLAATCVEYDALIEDPGEVVGELSRFVGRRLEASYVEPRLRRETAPVPSGYEELYVQVAALSGSSRRAMSAARPVTNLNRGAATRPATRDYVTSAANLAGRLRDAKSVWEAATRMPEFECSPEVLTATETYRATLAAAQADLASLVPPQQRVQRHGKLARRINLERMIAELTLGALGTADPRTREAARHAWLRFGGSAIP